MKSFLFSSAIRLWSKLPVFLKSSRIAFLSGESEIFDFCYIFKIFVNFVNNDSSKNF